MYLIEPLEDKNDSGEIIGATLVLFLDSEKLIIPISGVKVGSVINFQAIEYLQILKSKIDTNEEVEVEIKDCGNKNKGNYYKLLSFVLFGMFWNIFPAFCDYNECPIILSEYHKQLHDIHKLN